MAKNSVIGIITEVFPLESGTSANGKPWVRQSFIVSKIGTDFESLVQLDLKNQNAIDKVNPSVGMVGEFMFDPESRKSNDGTRYFTSLACYFVKPLQMPAAQPQNAQTVQQPHPMQQMPQSAPQQPQWGAQQNPYQQGGWQPNNGNNGGNPF